LEFLFQRLGGGGIVENRLNRAFAIQYLHLTADGLRVIADGLATGEQQDEREQATRKRRLVRPWPGQANSHRSVKPPLF
jgi:hypothetical protein